MASVSSLTISRPGNINLSLPQNQSAPGPLVVATLWTCYECIVQYFFKSSKNSVRSFGSCCITELSCSVRFLWVIITWTSSSTLSRFRIFRKKVKGLLISVLLLYSVLTYHLHQGFPTFSTPRPNFSSNRSGPNRHPAYLS